MVADLEPVRPCTGSPQPSSDSHHSDSDAGQQNFGAIGSFRTSWPPDHCEIESRRDEPAQPSPAALGRNANEEQVPEGRAELSQHMRRIELHTTLFRSVSLPAKNTPPRCLLARPHRTIASSPPRRRPLPDRLTVFVAEDEGFTAAGDFPGKDRFHTFKLHLRANHLDYVALVEDKIVGFYELRDCKVDLNRLAGR